MFSHLWSINTVIPLIGKLTDWCNNVAKKCDIVGFLNTAPSFAPVNCIFWLVLKVNNWIYGDFQMQRSCWSVETSLCRSSSPLNTKSQGTTTVERTCSAPVRSEDTHNKIIPLYDHIRVWFTNDVSPMKRFVEVPISAPTGVSRSGCAGGPDWVLRLPLQKSHSHIGHRSSSSLGW